VTYDKLADKLHQQGIAALEAYKRLGIASVPRTAREFVVAQLLKHQRESDFVQTLRDIGNFADDFAVVGRLMRLAETGYHQTRSVCGDTHPERIAAVVSEAHSQAQAIRQALGTYDSYHGCYSFSEEVEPLLAQVLNHLYPGKDMLHMRYNLLRRLWPLPKPETLKAIGMFVLELEKVPRGVLDFLK